MNNKSKKTINIKTTEKILYFPNKLNLISIFLIVILYGSVLFVCASLVFPKYDNMVTLNYEPSEYSEEINPFILVKSEAIRDATDSSIIKVPTRLYSYIYSMNSKKNTVTKYVVSALDTGGIMRYFRESPNGTTYVSNINGYQSNSITINNGLDKLFMKVRYKAITNEVEEEKEIKFSEDILQLSQKDFTKYSLVNKDDNVGISFTFITNSTDENKFDTNFKLELTNKDKRHHINFQSWLVTEDSQILPFLGLYNYSDKKASFQPISTTNVNKDLNIKWVYGRVVYRDIDSGEVSELLYKISVGDLTNN